MKLIDFDYVVINTKIVPSKYKIIEVDRNMNNHMNNYFYEKQFGTRVQHV